MPPPSVTPAKYCSMSATVTGSLATATTSRWGWEIVQWTGMARKLTSRPPPGHADSWWAILPSGRNNHRLRTFDSGTTGGPDEQSRRDHPREASGPPDDAWGGCAQPRPGSRARHGHCPRVGAQRGTAAAGDRCPD